MPDLRTTQKRYLASLAGKRRPATIINSRTTTKELDAWCFWPLDLLPLAESMMPRQLTPRERQLYGVASSEPGS